MKKLFTYGLAMVGALVATGATQASVILWIDEPKMPASLAKK